MYASKQAMKQALGQIENFKFKIENFEVVEVHDCFSVAGLIALEDLGFCGVGEAPTFMSNNRTLSINPSGGLKACGHPVGATGVKQVVAVARELMKGKGVGFDSKCRGARGRVRWYIYCETSYQEPETRKGRKGGYEDSGGTGVEI
jgi:acetyl-CoA acetyltransferase